jgi:hypothetical protein
MAVDFTRASSYVKDANYVNVKFGDDAPVLENELNEAQDIIRNKLKDTIYTQLGDGLYNSNNITYTSGTFKITDTYALLNGELLYISTLSLALAEGESVYLDTTEAVKMYTDTIKRYGNQQETNNSTNKMFDTAINTESTRRTELIYNLTKTTGVAGHNYLKIGTITSGAFVLSCRVIKNNAFIDTVNTAVANLISGYTVAGKSSKWATARNLKLTGTVTGSAYVDGSGDVTIATTKTPYEALYSFGNVQYMKLATITVTSSFQNSAITFDLAGRSNTTAPTHFAIKMVNSSTIADTTVYTFSYAGNTFYGNGAKLYKISGDTTSSVFEVWIQQSESYDTISVGSLLNSNPNISVSFVGTTSASLPTTYLAVTDCYLGTIANNINGTATKWASAMTLSATSDVTGSVSFDGSTASTLALTLANTGVTAGTYFKTTVDAKGRVTSGVNPTTLDGFGITDALKHFDYSGVAQDFNTLTTTGIHDIKMSSNTNAPTTNNGRLVVNFDIGTPYQLWYPDNTPTVYKRNYSNSTWSSWTNMFSASNVGLGNVTNESKATMFTSPVFTGTPTAPTASAGTNTTQLATTAFVSTAIANLVNGAQATLDTLKELSDALGDDPNFATTMTNNLATKAPINNPTFTGTITTGGDIVLKGHVSVIDGVERTFRAYNTANSVNWGYYVNNTGIGSYDWQNGRFIMSYATGTNTIKMGTANAIVYIGKNTIDDGTGNVFAVGTIQGTQLKSTVATGTAPLTVASSTMVTNLNANYLSGMTVNVAGQKDTWGTIPSIGATDGVMEVGKYLDFHVTDGSTADYDVRLTADTGSITCSGALNASTSMTAPTFNGALNGNATSASKWATARTLTLGGDLTGSVSIDGSANVSLNAIVIDDSHNHTMFKRIDLSGQTLDLNTITLSDGTTHQKHYIEFTTGGSTGITNKPVADNPFILDVQLIRYNGSSDYITKQTFTDVGSKAVYFRYCTNGTWDSTWSKMYSTTAKPYASDVGLGNVTNESKATMFNNPTFTGKVATSKNVIDDGNGNMNVAGAITLPAISSSPALITQNANGVTYLDSYLNLYTSNSFGWWTVNNADANGNNHVAFKVHGYGSPTPNRVETPNVALDDGSGNILFANKSDYSYRGIYGTVGDNDYWRIAGAATATDAGYLEIATSDSGTEPIFVRQYNNPNGSGPTFTTVARTLTLLDNAGNSTFPGSVTAPRFLAYESSTTSGGFSFTQDGAQDTGMFSPSDGQLNFYSNGAIALSLSNDATYQTGNQIRGYDIVRSLSGGYFIQSGTVYVSLVSGGCATTTVTFPVAFTHGVNPRVYASLDDVGYGGGKLTTGVGIDSSNLTQATINVKQNGTSTGTVAVRWLAIGV